MPPWVVLAALVTGAIGAVIGHRKGHPVWGFFTGFLLSVIGIAIVAVTKPGRQAARTHANSVQEPRPGPVATYSQALQQHDE